MKKNKVTKIVLSVLSIGLVISLLISTTYALFSVDSYGAQPNDYTTGMLSIEAVSKSDTISLTNALPMTDEEGVETTPYVFSIKNIGNLDYQFDIELLSTGDASNTFPSSIIRLQIDDGEVTTLAEIGGKIKEDVVLLAHESLDVSIRIWLSKEDTTNEHLGMSFNSKIVTNGQAVYTSSNSEYVTFVDYLTDLYLDANPTQASVANNGINYYYAPSVNMMNDGMGSNHTWEDGANTGNIRYYGATPSNYIDIGDRDSEGNVVPWRIIGVFKNMKIADGTTDTLVKVVRDEAIGNMAWNDNGNNDWNNATLKTYLNEGDYYTGLSQSVKDKIVMVEWNLGGYDNSSVYSDVIYFNERGDGKSNNLFKTTWNGNVALMYPSDYGYAADLTKCGRTLFEYYSDEINCLDTNWLFNNKYSWLLTPIVIEIDMAWDIGGDGGMYSYTVSRDFSILPTLYLKSNLVKISGDGSSVENAYVLG